MKTFAVLLLLSAFAAYVSAEVKPFHPAIFQFLDERHDDEMAQVMRDQGLPEDTLVASDHPEPPDWIVYKWAPATFCWGWPCDGLAAHPGWSSNKDTGDKLRLGPPWIKPCLAKGKKCWQGSQHDACKKICCIENFWRCVISKHPKPLPTLSPLKKGCLALLHLCRNHSPTCAGELCCFVRIKRCFEAAEGGKE